MLGRYLGLACLMFFISVWPLRGLPPAGDPWRNLEKGLSSFDVEYTAYRGYFFVPGHILEEPEIHRLAGLAAGHTCSGEPFPLSAEQWWASSSVEPGYTVLRISGAGPEACRLIWDGLQAAAGSRSRELAVSWSVEAYLRGEPENLILLGMELIDGLGALPRGANVYNGAVNLLAYAPWAGETVNLPEGPVNINLELYRDPVTNRVRLRAGIPVLLSLSIF